MEPPHPSILRNRTSSSNEAPFGLALALAALAGWVDSAGVVGSTGVFLSFMSGNTTDLARSLVDQDWHKAAIIAAVLGLFVAGVIFGELLEPRGGQFGTSLVLATETILLAGAATLHCQRFGMPAAMAGLGPYPLVLAMGLQNATMHRAGGISIGLTYVTGTLVQIGRALASMMGSDGSRNRLLEYVALWLGLACGAACGASTVSVSALAALSLATCVAGSLAAATGFSQMAPRP